MFRRRQQRGTTLEQAAGNARFGDPDDPFWEVFVESLVFVAVRFERDTEVRYQAIRSHGQPTVSTSEELDHLRVLGDYRVVRLRVAQLILELPVGHAVAIHLSADDAVVLPSATIDWLRSELDPKVGRRRSD